MRRPMTLLIKFGLPIGFALSLLAIQGQFKPAFAQETVHLESFETDGEGTRYTTSNSFNDGVNDHFQRTDGSDIDNESGAYSNIDGTYFWAGEDLDDDGGDTLDTKTITLTAVDISSHTNIEFRGLFGAGDAGGPENSAYDDTDYVKVTYRVDGGAVQNGVWFSYENTPAGGKFNAPIGLDANFDGEADATNGDDRLDTTLQEFDFAIPDSDSVVVIIEVHADSEDEEIAFDNLRIVGDSTATCFAEIEGDNDTDFASTDAAAVQQAIDAVVDDGTVKLAGYCQGVSVRDSLTQTGYVTRGVTLRGGYTTTNWMVSDPNTYSTTLDADTSGRVLVISDTIDVVVESLQLINGSTMTNGGGIWLQDATLAISNTQLTDNYAAEDGGGLFSNNGDVTFLASRIADNYAEGISSSSSGSGGGIFTDGGVIAIETTVISNNDAEDKGGGLHNLGGTVAVVDSDIVDNDSEDDGGGVNNHGGVMSIVGTRIVGNYGGIDGGGIHNTDGGRLTVDRSEIRLNEAYDHGAGIYTRDSGAITVTASTIISNDADTDGGGIGIEFNGVAMISDTLILLNEASEAGGGIANGIAGRGGAATIVSSKIMSNTATFSRGDGGGGIYSSDALTITNSDIISNTSATVGAGIYVDSGDATVVDSRILDNFAEVDGGGIFNDGDLTIRTSEIISNRAANEGGGIYSSDDLTVDASRLLYNVAGVDGGALLRTHGVMTVTNGCIVWNSDIAVSGADIDATSNWWGAADGPGGAAAGSGDSVSAGVAFTPFEPAPILGCPTLPLPQLVLEKTVNEDNPTTNDTITYTIVISNGGQADATGGILSDTIPNGLTFVPNSVVIAPAGSGTPGAPSQLVTGLKVEAGKTTTVTFQATVNGGLVDGMTIANTAWATATQVLMPVADTVTITVDSPPVEDITVELALAGMAITNFDSGGGGYGAGILDWVWTILNPNVAPVSNIYIDVIQLDASIAEVINRDGGTPPGAGARVSVPNSALGGDNMLTTGENFAQLFQLGWKSYSGFTFQVQAFGVVGTPLVAGEPQLLGTFSVEFDPSMVDLGQEDLENTNKLFVPLIRN